MQNGLISTAMLQQRTNYGMRQDGTFGTVQYFGRTNRQGVPGFYGNSPEVQQQQKKEQALQGPLSFLGEDSNVPQDQADEMLLDELANDPNLEQLFKPRVDEARQRLLQRLQQASRAPYEPPEVYDEAILDRRYGADRIQGF